MLYRAGKPEAVVILDAGTSGQASLNPGLQDYCRRHALDEKELIDLIVADAPQDRVAAQLDEFGTE